jgi:hypothetical protein
MEHVMRMVDELEFRKVKALEDMVDYMRRMDGMMQTLLQTLERMETDVQP